MDNLMERHIEDDADAHQESGVGSLGPPTPPGSPSQSRGGVSSDEDASNNPLPVDKKRRSE